MEITRNVRNSVLAIVLGLAIVSAGFSFASAQMMYGAGVSDSAPGYGSDGWDPDEGEEPGYGQVVYHSYANGTHTLSGELPYYHEDGFCYYDGSASASVHADAAGHQIIDLVFTMHGTDPSQSGMCTMMAKIIPYSITVQAAASASVNTTATMNGTPLSIDVQEGAYASPWGPGGPTPEPPCEEFVSDDGLTVGCAVRTLDEPVASLPPAAATPVALPRAAHMPMLFPLGASQSEQSGAQPLTSGIPAAFGFNANAEAHVQSAPAAAFFERLFSFFFFWR